MIVAAIAAVLVAIVFAIGGFTGGMFNNTCTNLAKGEYQTPAPTCP